MGFVGAQGANGTIIVTRMAEKGERGATVDITIKGLGTKNYAERGLGLDNFITGLEGFEYQKKYGITFDSDKIMHWPKRTDIKYCDKI